MSFDIGVWYSDRPLTKEQAEAIYLKMCEEGLSAESESAQIASFYKELTEHWPEIDTIPEERIGDFDYCPWSCALDHSGTVVLMNCVWSKATDVASFVSELARKHQLVLFDPQSGKVHLPSHLAKKRGLFSRFFSNTDST